MSSYLGKMSAVAVALTVGVSGCGDDEGNSKTPADSQAAMLTAAVWDADREATIRPIADHEGVVGATVQIEGVDRAVWAVFMRDEGDTAELAEALRAGPVEVTLRGDTIAGLMGFDEAGEPITLEPGADAGSHVLTTKARSLCGWHRLEGDGQVDFGGKTYTVVHRLGAAGEEPFAFEPEHECGYTWSDDAPDCNVGYGCEWGSGPGGPPQTFGVCSSSWHDGWTRNVCYCDSGS